MKVGHLFVAGAMAALLTGCGGGGGGINSTPTPHPTPSPTPATNASLTDLRYSQSFANDAVEGDADITSPSNQIGGATQNALSLTISYDADSQSYTVSIPGRSDTFAPADKAALATPGLIDYQKTDGSTVEYFSLTDPNATTGTTYRYVGGGYWQRNTTGEGALDLAFDAFTYGISTPASAVPRTGNGGYDVDLFGFFAPVNGTPKALSGTGTFTADFLTNNFQTSGTAYESELGADYYTGTYEWRGAGHFASASNSFSGGFAYDGSTSPGLNGTITGRLYGPQGQELGAVFRGDDADGSSLTGTLLGKSDDSIAPVALTVTNLPGASSFYTQQGSLLDLELPDGSADGAAPFFPDDYGTLKIDPGKSYQLVPASSSSFPSPTFAESDKVAAKSTSRYTVYDKKVGDQSFELTLYNPATGGTVPLTYSSFGRWDFSEPGDRGTQVDNIWFVYGIPTPAGSLERSGNAHFDGEVHGSSIVFASGTRYNLSGAAAMDVDFSTMAFDGSMSALGTPVSGGKTLDYGTYSFGGQMNTAYGFESGLSNDNNLHSGGDINGRLYGPGGEEWGARFFLATGDGGTSATGQLAGVITGTRK